MTTLSDVQRKKDSSPHHDDMIYPATSLSILPLNTELCGHSRPLQATAVPCIYLYPPATRCITTLWHRPPHIPTGQVTKTSSTNDDILETQQLKHTYATTQSGWRG
jgi:hypothetical protein